MTQPVLDQAPASSAPTQGRRGGVLAVAGVAATGLAVGVLLAAVDPHEPGHYPTCPFLATTGLYCPGCGALRATHDLLHGDVVGALARNPLTVLAAPYLLLAFVTWALRRLGRPAPRSTSLPPWAIWSLLALVVGFGVLRNLPGFAFLSPA
ncbi:DUF2752 domain-containing protein [Nocardioides aurantiacus]|uniref:Uncharacterized protein DUF2752 n=1 Tax=Nocardioides aurantiacus TaxID=86796 RepID=A0A3N2CPT4_9ACTN|nr:DUF2752 domain-containing protein [Nocardioides aurantiacus]ROR89530.1 uncharacterized protein DUF2752 [Nocardioides aurantiacus]